MLPQSWLIQTILLCSFSTHLMFCSSESLTIYEVLCSHGLPMGLLPKGVKDFSLDVNGRFEFHLDKACNAKFENELHYDRNISGTLTYGKIAGISGISAQDLFLWFPVKKIRVDIPSSGVIYFDVGVVSKQFSFSSFETPRDCLAAQVFDDVPHRIINPGSASKSVSGKHGYQLEEEKITTAIL